MPLYFHSSRSPEAFEARMGQGLYGPRSGRLGAPTNTTFATAPAAVQTFARTVAPVADFCRDRVDPEIGTYKPSIYIAGGYYRLAAIQAIVNCTPGDAPLREWMKFVRGESTDLGKVVSILTAASSMADILAGLMSGQTGATVRAVTSDSRPIRVQSRQRLPIIARRCRRSRRDRAGWRAGACPAAVSA